MEDYKLNDVKDAAWREIVKECDLPDGECFDKFYLALVFILHLQNYIFVKFSRLSYISITKLNKNIIFKNTIWRLTFVLNSVCNI